MIREIDTAVITANIKIWTCSDKLVLEIKISGTEASAAHIVVSEKVKHSITMQITKMPVQIQGITFGIKSTMS